MLGLRIVKSDQESAVDYLHRNVKTITALLARSVSPLRGLPRIECPENHFTLVKVEESILHFGIYFSGAFKTITSHFPVSSQNN